MVSVVYTKLVCGRSHTALHAVGITFGQLIASSPAPYAAQVFRGTSLMSENTLLDLPTGVVTFHMDTTEPRVPAIAVASGAYIYIYKNLRPYFKFTLPTLDVNPSEFDLWTQVASHSVSRSGWGLFMEPRAFYYPNLKPCDSCSPSRAVTLSW